MDTLMVKAEAESKFQKILQCRFPNLQFKLDISEPESEAHLYKVTATAIEQTDELDTTIVMTLVTYIVRNDQE